VFYFILFLWAWERKRIQWLFSKDMALFDHLLGGGRREVVMMRDDINGFPYMV
jgi:hypothetical protein